MLVAQHNSSSGIVMAEARMGMSEVYEALQAERRRSESLESQLGQLKMQLSAKAMEADISSREVSARKQELVRLRSQARQGEQGVMALRRELGVSCGLLAYELGRAELDLTRARSQHAARDAAATERRANVLRSLAHRFGAARELSERWQKDGNVVDGELELVIGVGDAARRELDVLRRQLESAQVQMAQAVRDAQDIYSLHMGELEHVHARLRESELQTADVDAELKLARARQQQLVALLYAERRAHEEDMATAKEVEARIRRNSELASIEHALASATEFSGIARVGPSLHASASWAAGTPTTWQVAPHTPRLLGASAVYSPNAAEPARTSPQMGWSRSPLPAEASPISNVWRRRSLGHAVYRFLIAQPLSRTLRSWALVTTAMRARTREQVAALAACIAIGGAHTIRLLALTFNHWCCFAIAHRSSSAISDPLVGAEASSL